MSVKITGDKDRIVNKVQSRLDKFSKCTKAFDKARKALDDLEGQKVELANIPAREDRYNIVLSEYKEAAKNLKSAAVKIEAKTDDKHLHKYCKQRDNQFRHLIGKDRAYYYIDAKYQGYLEGVHDTAEEIIKIDFDTQVSQAQSESQRRKAEAYSAIEFSTIDQTFPSCRDRLIQENPNEYLRQAALYQHKLLEKKDETEALAFGNAWIKSLPLEATWQQVEDMSFMMIEAAKTNEKVDLSEYRNVVEQWSREHPLSENPDPAHLTPDHATTAWGRRTYLLGLLANQNSDISPEAFQLYQNCGFLYPDQHRWKVAQAYYHISKLQCIEAEQLLDGLPKEDSSVIQVQKYLKVAKAEKELSLIDQTFPNSRDELLQENPDEYLRQAALYQYKLLKTKDRTEVLAFGNSWIKNLPKEATWEQVEDMSFIMIEAAATNHSADLSEYRAAVQHWLQEHPLTDNPDSIDVTPAQATTPWGRRTYIVGLLYFHNQNIDLSPEAFQAYQNCSALYPDQHFWKEAQTRYKIAQAHEHISNLQWVEAEQSLVDLPSEDALVRNTQIELNYGLNDRIASFGMDMGLIVLPRIIPSSYRETATFDIAYTGLHLLTNGTTRRMWVPRVLGIPERAIPFNPFKLPPSAGLSLLGDVVDCLFRRCADWMLIQNTSYTKYSFVSCTLRTANTVYTLTDPSQRSLPSLVNLGSQLISLDQSYAECQEIRRSATYHFVTSGVQIVASDLTAAYTIISYSDLIPVAIARLPQFASFIDTTNLETRVSCDSSSTSDGSSRTTWLLAAAIGSWAAYRFYYDYAYLWAVSVMSDMDFYFSQGKHEEVQRILDEAENSYFVSRAKPTVRSYAQYVDYLKDYHRLLNDPVKCQDFLMQLDLLLNINLNVSSHYRGIRNNVLLKKLETAIIKKDTVRLKEVFEEGPNKKFGMTGVHFFLSHTFNFALNDLTEASSFLEEMKPSFPSDFHPTIESFLELLQTQSDSLKEWPQLDILSGQQNPIFSKKATQWVGELQQLQDFFSKTGEKPRICQDLQYYKLIIAFSQTDDTQQIEALFKESSREIHQRLSHVLVQCTRQLKKTGKHQKAITLLKRAEIHSFADNQLIQNYGRFFFLIYSLNLHKDSNVDQLKDLESCIACLDTKEPAHQQLYLFFSASRIVLNLDFGSYANAQELLVQAKTDMKVLDETAALLFERVFISVQGKRDDKARSDLKCVIENSGSWKHLELFTAYHDYLKAESSLEVRFECLTTVLKQIESIEQLSEIETDLRHQKHLLEFELRLFQGDFETAKGFLVGPLRRKLYAQLCNILSAFFVQKGEQLRQNHELSITREDLLGLNTYFEVPNSKVFQSYINFLAVLDKIKGEKDIAMYFEAYQALNMVFKELESIKSSIPKLLILEQIKILIKIATLAKDTGQQKIGLETLETIEKVIIEKKVMLDEKLNQVLSYLKEQMNA